MENKFVCILVSGACGCAAPSAERFMLIAESGRVHLHGRSYEGCATIGYPTSKTVSAIWPKCIMGVHSLIWPSVLKAYGSFKCVCKIELYVMSDLSDKSEQK